MPDDCAFNIKFIEVVEKYPCIYDYTLEDHNKRKVVEQAWTKIGSELKLSIDQCKEKWKNLRTALSRSMKKPNLGSGAKKKKYYLQDAMHYVLPFMKCNNQSGTFPPSLEGSAPELSNDNSNDTAESELLSNSLAESSQQINIPEKIHNHYPSEILKEHIETPNRNSNKRTNVQRREDDIDKSIIDYIKLKKAKASMSNHSNPDLDFFKSLLPDLNKMSDYHKRQFKKRTLDIIDSILCDGSSQNLPYVPASASSPALSNYSEQS